MRSLLRSIAAAALVLLLATSTLGQDDDEWLALLLITRDELDAGIAQIDREMAEIPDRIASDDWRVFPTESGQVVEIDLRDLEALVPMAQLVGGHPEIKPVLLDGLKEADFDTWAAVMAMDAVGGLENLPPADVVGLVRTFYTQSAEVKQDVYAGRLASLQAERDDLAKLRADIQQQLDALATTAASPSPLPSEEPTPGIEVEGVQYDALEGLTTCDEDEPACETMGALSSCWGNELGCYAPLFEVDAASGLWSTGVFDGDFESWAGPVRLAQTGTTVSGMIEGQRGPLEIEAEEVRRNRVEGHYYGDVFWVAGGDDGRMGPEGAPFEGCSTPRDGTTQWGEVAIRTERYTGDREPRTHLTITVRPCDQAWRDANPAYDNANEWLAEGALAAPEGFAWAATAADADHQWTGDWRIDLGSMRIDQQGEQLSGLILSPGASATFEAEPMDPAIAGDLYDPAVTMLGEWQGDAFAAWLAGYGDIPDTWSCGQPRDGFEQWGEILLRLGDFDGNAPDRIDAAWMPCDPAWREAKGYNDDGDWWYDGEDLFTGWRLAPASELD